MLRKAGKAISEAHTRAAHLEAENQRLLHQLDQAKSIHLRKRVRIDPNERFHNIVIIKVAVYRAAALSAQKGSKSMEDEARKAASTDVALTFGSMCTEWQI